MLAILLFSAAVGGATLAGSGMVVAPHVEPPGTPRVHDHVLAAYRYPLFLLRLQMQIEQRLGLERPGFRLEAPLANDLAALVMALLVVATPALPRPARRVVAKLAPPRVGRPQWRPSLPLAPPETGTLLPFPA